MRTFAANLLFLFLAAAAFGQPLVDVRMQGGRYLAPMVNFQMSKNTSVVFESYDEDGVQSYVNYRLATATVNSQSDMYLNVLAGGASDGFVGGVMLGEKHREFYWNVIAGNIYCVAAGVQIPHFKDYTVSGYYGKRGYGGDVEYKLIKRTWFINDGLSVTGGWGKNLGFNVGLKTTFVLSQ